MHAMVGMWLSDRKAAEHTARIILKLHFSNLEVGVVMLPFDDEWK